ncbi:unnamed protein product [Rhodiola kirilowii]
MKGTERRQLWLMVELEGERERDPGDVEDLREKRKLRLVQNDSTQSDALFCVNEYDTQAEGLEASRDTGMY